MLKDIVYIKDGRPKEYVYMKVTKNIQDSIDFFKKHDKTIKVLPEIEKQYINDQFVKYTINTDILPELKKTEKFSRYLTLCGYDLYIMDDYIVCQKYRDEVSFYVYSKEDFVKKFNFEPKNSGKFNIPIKLDAIAILYNGKNINNFVKTVSEWLDSHPIRYLGRMSIEAINTYYIKRSPYKYVNDHDYSNYLSIYSKIDYIDRHEDVFVNTYLVINIDNKSDKYPFSVLSAIGINNTYNLDIPEE